MLVSGIKMFNNGISGLKNAAAPFKGSFASNAVAFGGGCDSFTRSVGNESSSNNVREKAVPPNVRKYLGEDVKYLDDAKEILNTRAFKFNKNGEVFEGTLKQYLESCKGRENTLPFGYTMYHATTREAINSMFRDGLDYTQTSRMKCGPGVYFAPAIGAAMDFGSAFVEASPKGDTKYYSFESCFFDPVSNNAEILTALSEELGVSKLTASGLLKVASHDILVDDMGVDMLYAGSGYSTGSYVVLNPDCVRLSRA